MNHESYLPVRGAESKNRLSTGILSGLDPGNIVCQVRESSRQCGQGFPFL